MDGYGDADLDRVEFGGVGGGGLRDGWCRAGGYGRHTGRALRGGGDASSGSSDADGGKRAQRAGQRSGGWGRGVIRRCADAALPAPAVTPDVVVRAVGEAVVMPDEEGSAVAEPELTPDVSGRCWADQRRVMEWEPAITGATLDRVCALAPIAPQDYELVESFAECAGEHLLLWDMSDAGDAYGGESGAPLTGTDPRDYRTRMLLGLDDVDREGKRGFVEAVCAPGPDAELRQFAADWTRCLEADEPLLQSFREFLGRSYGEGSPQWGRDHGGGAGAVAQRGVPGL